MKYTFISLLILCVIGFAYQSKKVTGNLTKWTTEAIVIDPHLTPNSMMLQHPAIDGLMPAMTMPFTLKNQAQRDGIGFKDKIEITFHQNENAFVIQAIRLINVSSHAQLDATNNSASNAAKLREVNVPWHFELVNQLGQQTTLDALRDKTLVINFIYTRCPAVCPMQTAQLGNVFKKLTSTQKKSVHFVSISLDPLYDTPEMLHGFMAKHQIDDHAWTFLTGEQNTIERTMNSFNILKQSKTGIDIDHTPGIFVVKNSGDEVINLEGLSDALVENLWDSLRQL